MTQPAPYPADTRAKGWRFELDHESIFESDTWALAAPEIRPWLLMIWTVAWRQSPCGTLPADDALISARIGMPLDLFTHHRAVLLRGWWRADDDRLYHNTLTKRVLEMLATKEKDRVRKADYRRRVSEGVTQVSRDSPQMSHGTDGGRTAESTRSDDTGTGTGTSSSSQPCAGGECITPNQGREPKTPTPPPTDQPESFEAHGVSIGAVNSQSNAFRTLIGNWSPKPSTVEALRSPLHAIPAKFIDEQVLEFRTYWRDRDTPTTSWDSKFIQRCAGEWKRNGHQWTPTPEGKIHAISQPNRRQTPADRIREQARRIFEANSDSPDDGAIDGAVVGADG